MEEFYSVIGAGGWGTALSLIMAGKGYRVKLWVRTDKYCEEVRESRENKKYLPGVCLPDNVVVSSDLEEIVKNSRMMVVAVPSHSFRKVVREIKKYISKDVVLVSSTKGIETDTLLRMSQVLEEELGAKDSRGIAALSGPNHAEEVSRGVPSATVVASEKRKTAKLVQDIFMSPSFRVYTNPDLAGVELGGSLKNIIALGSGISDGLGFGDNTRAALMTRGLVEISRLGIEMGASPLTFAGLSGVGDLIATCTSNHSRNRKAGIMLGEGKKAKDITRAMEMVVEGIKTTEAAWKLSEKHGVEMPITREVYQVIFDEKKPRSAVEDLMLRDKKFEMEEIVRDNLENW